MLLRSGQVAIPPVRESDDHGFTKGTFLAELETDLDEHLEGQAADGEVADADRLDRDGDGLFGALGGGDDAGGVMLGESGQGIDLLLHGRAEDLAGGGDVFLGGTPIAQFDLTLDHAELRRLVVGRDLAMGEPRGIGGLLRDDADLLEGLARRTGHGEGNVVDVARSSVREHRDHGAVATETTRHQPGKLAEIIGRDLIWRGRSHIMQGVAGIEGDLLALFILNRKDKKIRIGRRGGTVEGFGIGAGIHAHFVHFPERILGHLPGLEIPAAIKDFFGQRMTRGSDSGGAARLMRLHDGVNKTVEEVLAIGRLGTAFLASARRGCAVRVGRRNEDVCHGDTGFLRGDLVCLDNERGGKAEIVDQNHGERGRAIIENDGPRMERIVRALGTVRAEPAGHVERELLRRDVGGEGSGAEDGGVLRGGETGKKKGGSEKKMAFHGWVFSR